MRLAAVAACLAVVVGGCGGARAHTSTHATPVAVAERTHEYPSPPPPPEAATGGAGTATATIRAFASAYINWSYATVVGDLRGLAQASVGQARSAMTLAAAQSAGDYELQHGGVSNHGTVEAVAPLARHRNQYVVVTREVTTATVTTAYQGLRPAWHITLATTTRLPDGRWAVSGWQPQS